MVQFNLASDRKFLLPLSEIPANKSMNCYFISHGSKFRGRPFTTLPVVLNKDLTRVSDDKLQLTSLKDLEHLRSVAQNRQTWRKLTTRIREAAEASLRRGRP